MSLTEQGYDPPPGPLLDWLRAIHRVVTVDVENEIRKRQGGGQWPSR